MRVVALKDMIVFIVGDQIDVFVGIGWDHWTRFQRTSEGLKFIKGETMPDGNFRLLKKVLVK